MKRAVGFFDWNNNYCESDICIVEKSEINPLFDNHVASVELNNGEYLEIYYNTEGELVGYYN